MMKSREVALVMAFSFSSQHFCHDLFLDLAVGSFHGHLELSKSVAAINVLPIY